MHKIVTLIIRKTQNCQTHNVNASKTVATEKIGFQINIIAKRSHDL